MLYSQGNIIPNFEFPETLRPRLHVARLQESGFDLMKSVFYIMGRMSYFVYPSLKRPPCQATEQFGHRGESNRAGSIPQEPGEFIFQLFCFDPQVLILNFTFATV